MREFARVKRGDATPACCVRCERTDDLLDLGAEPIPSYGVVYLCMLCFAQLATGLGLVNARSHQLQLEAKDTEWQAKLDGARREADKLAQALGEANTTLTELAPAPTPNEWIEHELRNLADRIASGVLPDPGDGVGAAVLVDAAGDETPAAGPVGVPGKDPGNPGNPRRKRTRKPAGAAKQPGGEQPGVPEQTDGGDSDSVGEQPAADDQDDRPDGDESDEWLDSLERAND